MANTPTKLLYVEFYDHWTRDTSWIETLEDGDIDLDVVRAVGWLVGDSDEMLILSPMMVPDGTQWRCELGIVKRCITKLETIAVGSEEVCKPSNTQSSMGQPRCPCAEVPSV